MPVSGIKTLPCPRHSSLELHRRDFTMFPVLKVKQLEAVNAFFLNQDVFVSLPTNYGKSLIYLYPSVKKSKVSTK